MPKCTAVMGIRIIGAGLVGSEAAWQIVRHGVPVELFEMRPLVMTKAHRTSLCAELVCSNSLRGSALSNGVGLLKEELRHASSLIMEAASFSAVPAGGALAVDREVFSRRIDEQLRSHPLLTFRTVEVQELPEASRTHPLIVATGPLTSKPLARNIALLTGKDNLAFFDAISPILLGESLDHSQLFRSSRYGKGEGDDYLNIPLSAQDYYAFVEAICAGEKFGGHDEVEGDCIADVRPFEGCMPIEEMAARGVDTLRFGPLKPVGLIDPRTNKRPYAVVQLRQDNREGTLWSLVGMQTRLKHAEQVRIFRMLPGLERAEFVRLGSVHRNTFIDSPKCLNPTLEFKSCAGLFFAGQLTGVEGYVESTAGGLVAGLNALRAFHNIEPVAFPHETAIGALHAYITERERKFFQPMNINYGLMPSYLARAEAKKRSKGERRLEVAEQALKTLDTFLPAITLSQ